MANIVQLKENGVITYPQTHVEAIIGLKKFKNENIIFSSGFKARSTDTQPVVSVYDKMAIINGTFTNSVVIKNSAVVTVGYLPSDVRPVVETVTLQQGSAGYKFMLLFKPDGSIQMERYSSGGDYADCKENSFLAMTAAIIIK